MKKQKLIKAWMIAKKKDGHIWSKPYLTYSEAAYDLVKYQSTFEIVKVEIRILK